MKAHFFNVGHGDTSLIDVANKKILVDCNITQDDDDIINEFKKLIPDKQIDYLFVTHPHRDHVLGLKLLVEDGFTFGKIYESGYRFKEKEKDQKTEEYEYAIKFFKEHSAEIPKESLNKINTEAEFEIYCLNSPNEKEETIHYNSLVIKVVQNGKSILFTGDSNCEVWKDRIIGSYDDLLDSDILHASHHGSRTFFWDNGYSEEDTGAYEEHIQFIMPEYTIISAPNENDKQDDWPPHDEAIKLYEDYTSSSGSVEITGEKDIIEFDLNSESCSIGDRPSISDKRKSLKGKWQPKVEIDKINTNNNSVQTPNLWG